MYIRVPVNHTLGESGGPYLSNLSLGSLEGIAQAPQQLDLSFWKDLISFRPPIDIQKKVLSKRWGFDWRFHRIEDGVGPVNLDYYPVKVSQLPSVLPVSVSSLPQDENGAIRFLEYIRKNINNFIDKRLTDFSPFNKNEENIWQSSNPLGSILHLNFRRLIGAVAGTTNIDDGSVVVSDFKPSYWRVYTIWTPADQGHPVSGIREWGFRKDGEGKYIFYTKAADRITKNLLLRFKDQVYSSQRQLWLSFQQAIAMFVNTTGGKAEVLSSTDSRYDWGQVSAQYHRPTTKWL